MRSRHLAPRQGRQNLTYPQAASTFSKSSLIIQNLMRAVNRQPWLPPGVTRRAPPIQIYHALRLKSLFRASVTNSFEYLIPNNFKYLKFIHFDSKNLKFSSKFSFFFFKIFALIFEHRKITSELFKML